MAARERFCRLTDQSLFTTLETSKFQILGLEKCEIVQPCEKWTKPYKDGIERQLRATELKRDEHFQFKPISQFVPFKEDFVNDFLTLNPTYSTEGNICCTDRLSTSGSALVM